MKGVDSTLKVSYSYPKQDKQHTGNTDMNEVIGYNVIDIQTKAVVKSYGQGKGNVARAYANKKDLAYGAIRYSVRPIYSEVN